MGPGPFLPGSGNGRHALQWFRLEKTLKTTVEPGDPNGGYIAGFGFVVAPTTARMAEEQLEAAFRSAAVWGLQAGKFHVLRQGELILYAEAIGEDGSTLKNIFIKQRNEEREQVWVAQKGRYWMDSDTGDRYLVLEDGKVTDVAPGQLDLRVLSFARNDLRLPEPEFRKTKERQNQFSVIS